MNPNDLESYLSATLGRPVALRINTNKRSIVSSRAGSRSRELRASIHRLFLDAPLPVLSALADFLRNPGPESRAVLREYFTDWEQRQPQPSAPVTRGLRRGETARGRFVDLKPRAAAIGRDYFGGGLDFDICWGKPWTPRRGQSTIRLGVWVPDRRLVRIHRALDSPFVPDFFRDYVIYHELCHAALPSRRDRATGRMLHHTEAFYALERQFRHYEEAIRWQEQNLDRLLRGKLEMAVKGQSGSLQIQRAGS
ncbi:MAG: hypothetical protein RLY93_04130 [Sumerlaeia bacterium]